MNPLRLLVLLVTLPLLLGGCGEKKNTYHRGVFESLHYSYTTKGGTVTIKGCENSATGDLIIPEIIDGKPVTSIDKKAFYKCSSLTSITIPDSVTSFGDYAFWNCTSLTAIEVSTGNPNITSVNGVLFSKDQTTLYIYPEGKKDAGYTIPNNVTRIATGAFFQCSNLKNITIPESVTSINPLSPPCIPPKFVLHGLSSKSKFLAV